MKKYIEQNNFNDKLYKKINNLIEKYGKDSKSYDANKKPFAVFDWDNTSIIGDVEESLLYYMVTRLALRMTPDELDEVIRKNVSKENFSKDFLNLEGKPINIDLLAKDIRLAYEKLYGTAISLGGDLDLEFISQTNIYKEFVAKMFFRYWAAVVDPTSDEKYCWMGFLLKNYRPDEVKNLCQEAFAYMKEKEVGVLDIKSPDIESMAGRVEITYDIGIGDVNEMANLYHRLEANGIDLYIVSASVSEVVKAYATSLYNSYKLDTNKVLGLRLEKDKDDKLLARLDKTYPLTVKEGKVETINKLIKNSNNYGPIIVGGDSDGDLAMFTSFDQMELGIIIDRQIGGEINRLKEVALDGSDKYIIQARDFSKKIFIKDERSLECILKTTK